MRVLLPLVLLASGVGAAPAMAATSVGVEGGVLTVAAAPGERNAIEIAHPRPDGSTEEQRLNFHVRDRVEVVAGPGCERETLRSVDCPAGGITEAQVSAGDGEDLVFVGGGLESGVHVAVFGGDGADRMEPGGRELTLYGEGGDDRLRGGQGHVLSGGAGHDKLSGAPAIADGGDGNDLIDVVRGGTTPAVDVRCGPGLDRVGRTVHDRIAKDCEELRGLDLGALGCLGRCLPDRSWRIRVRIGNLVDHPSDPTGAPRSATGTVYLRSWFRVTPPGGGARRHVRLGPTVPFSVAEGGRATVPYRLSEAGRRIVRARPERSPYLKVAPIIVSRNENGFLQEEQIRTIGVCHGARCRR